MVVGLNCNPLRTDLFLRCVFSVRDCVYHLDAIPFVPPFICGNVRYGNEGNGGRTLPVALPPLDFCAVDDGRSDPTRRRLGAVLPRCWRFAFVLRLPLRLLMPGALCCESQVFVFSVIPLPPFL